MIRLFEALCSLLEGLGATSLANTSRRGNYQKDVRELKKEVKEGEILGVK